MAKINELNLIGEVGTDITAQQVISFLNQNKGRDVKINIYSHGGDLHEGLTIKNILKNHDAQVIGEMIGPTASAGTSILMGCNERITSQNLLFLIHKSSASPSGNSDTLRDVADSLDKNDQMQIATYKEATGLNEAVISQLMKDGEWLTPQEAQRFGFIHKIKEQDAKITASINTVQNMNLNNQLLIKLQNKMKIFGSEKKDGQKLNVLALNDGKQLLINAETAETGVEVLPIGAETLADGEYTLDDGTKITVAGGMITNVVPKEEETAKEDGEKIDAKEIIEAVSETVVKEIENVEARIDAKIEALKNAGSEHKPAKGKPQANKDDKVKADAHSQIKAVVDGIHGKIAESRKA